MACRPCPRPCCQCIEVDHERIYLFSQGVSRLARPARWLSGGNFWRLHGGELSAQVYFRALKNRGHRPDKLLSARTSLTTGMAWQHIDTTQGAVRKTTVAAIDIPAHADVPMRHNSPQGHTLTLTGLPRPLAVGDRFSLWLRFEQAGEVEVKVVVQQPKDTPAAKTAHAH